MSEGNNTAVVSRDPAAAQADYMRQYEAGDQAPAVQDGATGTPAYLSFVWFKTQNEELKEQVKTAGGSIPTFVLTRAGHRQPVKPFRFHLFESTTIATQNDDSGRIVDAEASLPNLPKDELKRWAEHTFAVVGVIDGEFITPAFINLRSGARKALSYAITAVKDAREDRWAGKGAAFKAAVEATRLAPGRVVAVGSITPEKSPTNNNWFLSGKCSWLPSSAEDLARFNAAVSHPQFFLDLQATARVYHSQLKKLLSKEMDAPVDEVA